MAKKSDDGPKLARMKLREEAILNDDGPGVISRVADQNDFGKRYILKEFEREDAEDDLPIACARASAEASPRLRHAALVEYYDFRLKKSLFRTTGAELLMEYVDGRPVESLVDVPLGAWVAIFREVASALAHMHRRKILHGALSLSKILLTPAGKVKILGYGRSLVEGVEGPVGSKRTMAPEQIKGDPLTEKSDLYSLGACMYHAVTGKPANVGKRGEGELERISTPSALNPKVPVALNNLIVSLLQTKPAMRPESAYDVQQALDTLAQSLKVDEEVLAGLKSRSDSEPE
ncbi:MAG TPA: serine/threonine-protein kinase [Isosphaeraceae bacterium]|nr:serine/threonine-protein kinase [Isosphaeraceae bacterium]